jgi:hypothetical protein
MKKETTDQLVEICKLAAGENSFALQFLVNWLDYIEGITDFIADPSGGPDVFLKRLAETNLIYSSPYYAFHAPRLHLAVAKMFCEQSENKNSAVPVFSQMLALVAEIEGGFPRMKEVSHALKSLVDNPGASV